MAQTCLVLKFYVRVGSDIFQDHPHYRGQLLNNLHLNVQFKYTLCSQISNINNILLCEMYNRSVPLYLNGKHKKEDQTQDLFFEDFPSYVLLFELFQTNQIRIWKHFKSYDVFLIKSAFYSGFRLSVDRSSD